MVWFCHWFKSALPWFVLFSALQLCALCAASGAHLSLPLLDTLCQTSRKPSRQKVANVFLLLAWRAEQGQQDNYAKPAAEASVVWAGVIPEGGWATEQLTAAGKSVPRTGVMPPLGTWPACGVAAFPYRDSQSVPCHGPRWLARDHRNGERQTPNPKLNAQKQALLFCSLNQSFILINRSKRLTWCTLE